MAGATILGGIAGPELSRAERDFFRAADPWGFILFARNVDTPDRLRRLTAELREAVGRNAPVLVDQEGGRVQRMRAPHWTDWPAPLDQAGRGERAVWLHHHLLAQELRAVGIDADCAPVLDIARDETHPFLKNRCLGSDAETVIRLGRAAAQAMLAAGVLPVVKHMPGHGRARVDSHKDLPVVEASLDELRASDFAPFRALADLPMAMTAHIRFTAIDDAPATASAPVIEMIRCEIGFDGLLMSDDIGMQALSGSPAERAAAAIAAGCDLVLSCNETLAQMDEIVAAAGAMSPRAALRAEAALALRRAPVQQDTAALRAELAALGGLAA
ncbi:beta-N-acetylhexosaminidase [Paracoccus sp. P2]|uniref:beta-N-acetylhexosaminidase n=1 Tax=Paracoccus pantotrophus TaxID=82367 RepID=A0A7H9BSU0_PARPN|nr:beta-N-acetylhexosaminidase [Paracoccus pantotrophus]MDF3852998.1 beta-N-acetylhexosaminidase [Paracoccus pantotrophus]QLH13915.1 beta-N-acetylhexosaminidase [Paracoccus pantotrophus]RDE00996.1 beta-N-acetylhexosaminidase [Paracoccus pantotrophus]RNI17465.1 beta-N-acetylhexosaminidase [Paracoccus pantotrophus]WGR66953.1 beta-N-acetylhexosaminidase [Paracoccus pantotrophus]